MLRVMLHIIVVAGAIFVGSPAMAQEVNGVHGKAAASIIAGIRAEGLMSPVEAHVFYGDLTGRGTNDALALLYHPTGGNSDALTKWIVWDEQGGYRRDAVPALDEVHGIEPRNVKLSPGNVTLTMTTMRATDPRCCPSGQTTFKIALAGAPAALQRWTASSGGDNRVSVEGIAVDGVSRMKGTCAATGGAPGFWAEFDLDPERLESSEAQELLRLEISGRNGTRSFAVDTRLDQARQTRVADRPLSREFLDAFASGNEMRIARGVDGNEIANFGLAGTSRAVAMMRSICGANLETASAPVELPFVDGRYLSDTTLCGLTDEQIVERIGDEIHYVLYEIRNGSVGSSEWICDVRDVSRNGDAVRMTAQCHNEGMVNEVPLEMTYISDRSFRVGGRTFVRCD